MSAKKKSKPNCLYCGKPTKRATSKYCSVQCRADHWKQQGIHFGGPKRKLPERICLQCSTKFWRCYRSTCCSSKCMAQYRRDTGQLDQWIEQARQRTGPRNLSSHTRRKMSIAASTRNAARQYTKGIGGIRDDIGHYVRSRWEANLARILLYEEIEYQYESKCFQLVNTSENPITYTPDFKINSWYIEVKGWWDTKSKQKKLLMEQQYPEINIWYLSEIEYQVLEKHYVQLIPNWERKTRRPTEGARV